LSYFHETEHSNILFFDVHEPILFNSILLIIFTQNILTMKAYVFPGQGAQFIGMGKDLYESSVVAKDMFDTANKLLGFSITDIMFNGTDEQLKETKVTQPAVFLHSTILAKILGDKFKPDMVAGHSLGEFSALVANGVLSFEDGLRLVSKRALAMQKACESEPSTMAAILGLEDEQVEKVCEDTIGIVVPANYNCPGQLVISGSVDAINKACENATKAGAKRALVLQVGGAFHSPLMEPARAELADAIEQTKFNTGICPIYQNVNAKAVTDINEIKENLVAQLTAPVKWTQIMQQMIFDGCVEVIEVGPGNVLQGLFKKIDRKFPTSSAEFNS
jgi:[acyl-carrier-protein] S-malonyltransferase